MDIDLSQHTPDQIADLMARLPQFPEWPAEEAKATLVALAGLSGGLLPWFPFREAGKTWACAEAGPRLLEAACQAFEGTSHAYTELFVSARDDAIARKNQDLFSQLASPRYGWTPTEQSHSWAKITDRTPMSTDLLEIFWAQIPKEAQQVQELYCALAQDLGQDLERAIQGVLAFHAQNPRPTPEALQAGLCEALYFSQILMATDPVEDATLFPGLDTLLTHMSAEDLLEGLKAHAEKEGELSDFGMGLYHEVCDRILLRASLSTQHAWLARPGLTFPRTQAALRAHDLTHRPASVAMRSRRRS